MTLGEYSKLIPIELLTQKKGKTGSASPDVADGKGKRFGTFQEPGLKKNMKMSLRKNMKMSLRKNMKRSLKKNMKRSLRKNMFQGRV